MIDRRTFLARSSVATALAAVGVQQEHTQAPPLALPATVEPAPAPTALHPSHALFGHLMAYDSDREAVVSGSFELWTTATGCAFVVGNRQGEERRQIVFDQPQVVWAFTCLARLIQQQGHYQNEDDS